MVSKKVEVLSYFVIHLCHEVHNSRGGPDPKIPTVKSETLNPQNYPTPKTQMFRVRFGIVTCLDIRNIIRPFNMFIDTSLVIVNSQQLCFRVTRRWWLDKNELFVLQSVFSLE
jgi:hypothetical protein